MTLLVSLIVSVIAVIDPLVGVVGVAIIGPLGAYLVAARRFSGKIASSDASELWQESRSIRVWSQDQIEKLTARVAAVEEQNASLSSANNDLVQKLRDVSDLLTAARREIADLTRELKTSNARVIELEQQRAGQ